MNTKIVIIGQGNVAWHLLRAFSDENITHINSRTLDNLPIDADLYIISVKDDSIEEIAKHMPHVGGTVVHTSGSVSIDIISPYFEKCGVFYPLQTFTKGTNIDYEEIPIFIESSNDYVNDFLMSVCEKKFKHIYHANSAKRKVLHIASVFACNYANHLWQIASDLLSDENLDFSILKPLISATLDKAFIIGPQKAQTGPASRSDINIINTHLDFLDNKKDIQEIYKILAFNIINSKKI